MSGVGSMVGNRLQRYNSAPFLQAIVDPVRINCITTIGLRSRIDLIGLSEVPAQVAAASMIMCSPPGHVQAATTMLEPRAYSVTDS